MRLFVFNCLLLATATIALPNGRQKRDLSYLRNLINSAIFGRSQINIQQPPVLQTETEYKLFKLPGFDDIMIKVTPKKTVVEEFVYPAVEPVNLNAFGSVVGTKSTDDTLAAVKEVDNLLSTGILYGGHNNIIKETVRPMFPTLNRVNYVVEEKIKPAPVIETRPVFTEVIKPLEEKVEIKVPFHPKYSYMQVQNNEPVMTYTAHKNPDVEVMETIKMKTELPMCIKERVDEAILLGADPNQLAPVQEVYQYQTPLAVDFSYPRVEGNLYDQNSFREDLFIEGFETFADLRFSPQRFRPSKDGVVRHNVRPMKSQAINPRPLPLHSHKTSHLGEVDISASKDNVNSQTNKVEAFTSLGDKVDLSQTLGPIPPQYIIHRNKGGISAVSNDKIVKPTKVVPVVGSKDTISNAKIPSNVYLYQANPNTGKVETGSDGLRTNVKKNINQHSVASAVNSTAQKKDTTEVKNVVYTNTVTTEPQNATNSVIVTPKQESLREYIQTSFKNNPKIVPPVKNYSYQQKNANDTSINVKGHQGQHGISSDVKENNSKGRGDIPDQ